MMKTKSEESLRVLLRLVIDKIVEDLSKAELVHPCMPALACAESTGLNTVLRAPASDFQRADNMNETGR